MKTYTIRVEPSEVHMECSDGRELVIDFRDDEASITYYPNNQPSITHYLHPDDAMGEGLHMIGIL